MIPPTVTPALRYALAGGRAFLSTAPRLALGALVGAVLGFTIGALVGGALAGISALLWRGGALPLWLTASLFLTPVVTALAGGFIGFVRGVLSALANQLVEKKLLAWVYAQVKPAAVTALAKVGSSDAVKLAGAVRDEISTVFSREAAETPKPESFVDKVAQFITVRSRRMLALSVASHLARAKTGAAAAEEIEKLGLQKLELILVSSLEDLFSMKLSLVAGAALLLCIAPQLIFWFAK